VVKVVGVGVTVEVGFVGLDVCEWCDAVHVGREIWREG
jgi:hypothetical protein